MPTCLVRRLVRAADSPQVIWPTLGGTGVHTQVVWLRSQQSTPLCLLRPLRETVGSAEARGRKLTSSSHSRTSLAFHEPEVLVMPSFHLVCQDFENDGPFKWPCLSLALSTDQKPQPTLLGLSPQESLDLPLLRNALGFGLACAGSPGVLGLSQGW